MATSIAIADSSDELFEQAPCGYLSTLADGTIVRVNRTLLTLTGYSAEELGDGRRFASLLTMPGALLFETHCMPLLRLRGSVGEVALDVRCRDGQLLPVLLSAVVKPDPSGAPERLRIVLLNAPTRREYERELLRARTLADEATEQVGIHRELAERKVAEQQALLIAVERLTAGDLVTPVVVDGDSSQAPLSHSLERMRQDLHQQILDLQARNDEVQQLNAELRHQIGERSRLLVEQMQAGAATGASSGMDFSAVEAQPLLPSGTLLANRYRIEGILGQGAMGTVYEVERSVDRARFAAKVLRVKPDYQAMMRFAREAQLLARLAHPNLVAIIDINVTDDRVAYIVMELARGRSLAEHHDRFGDCDFILPVLLQVAQALTLVHDAGVVHRDLKPANVLLLATGDDQPARAKLVDFGVSRLLDAVDNLADGNGPASLDDAADWLIGQPRGFEMTLDGSAEDALAPPASAQVGSDALPAEPLLEGRTPSSTGPGSSKRRSRPSDKLTQAGAILGTPLYMAPELLRGSHLAQPPSDIFSFGVMAYETLTGTLPFAEVPLMLAAKGGGALTFPPLDLRCPQLPSELAHCLSRCLHTDPSERPTAAGLAVALASTIPQWDPGNLLMRLPRGGRSLTGSGSLRAPRR